jgi:hypothetical protein
MFSTNKIIAQQLKGIIPKPGKTGIDWFLFSYFLNKFNQNFLEIGVGNGGSLFTAVALSKNVTAIDSWNFGWKQSDIADILDTLDKPVKFINAQSEDVSLTQLNNYSFIHLDANKSYTGTLNDLKLCGNVCSGLICVDDYMNSMWPEVTWAVDDFIKENPAWHKVFIGNHQIFLSKQKVDIKELIIDFPLVNRDHVFYITYGQFPDAVSEFINNGKMTYTWQTIATSTDKNNW